jgi:hypothetical protein
VRQRLDQMVRGITLVELNEHLLQHRALD